MMTTKSGLTASTRHQARQLEIRYDNLSQPPYATLRLTDPKTPWETCWEVLIEDMEFRQRKLLKYPTLRLTDKQKKDHGLVEIEKLMREAGKTIKEYPEIQLPNSPGLNELGNKLLNEEMNNNLEQKDEHLSIFHNLNSKQWNAFDSIIESVHKNLGKHIFMEGYGDTGKTYLWKAITIKLHSEGKVVLAVASCGIAALLLQGGLKVPYPSNTCGRVNM
ncbi:hypothetical protein ACQ4PT_065011 [Festuca glaucescens]